MTNIELQVALAENECVNEKKQNCFLNFQRIKSKLNLKIMDLDYGFGVFRRLQKFEKFKKFKILNK